MLLNAPFQRFAARGWTRRLLLILALRVLGHLALASVVAGLLPENPYNAVEARTLATIVVVGALLFTALTASPQPLASALAGMLAVALVLYRPGPVAVVALLVADAWIVGTFLLARLAGTHDARIEPALAIACGLVPLMGFLAATGGMRARVRRLRALDRAGLRHAAGLGTARLPRNRLAIRRAPVGCRADDEPAPSIRHADAKRNGRRKATRGWLSAWPAARRTPRTGRR